MAGHSPNQKARISLLKAYRSRARRNSNLWLVYSPKTNRDWILPSDRQLIHWLAFLEAAPAVASFDLDPPLELLKDIHTTVGTKVDAVVRMRDGSVEWHEAKAVADLDSLQLRAQRELATARHITYRLIDDSRLFPARKEALRWLKPIAYAATIRERECEPTHAALASYVQQRRRGLVGEVLSDLNLHDSAEVVGVLVRLASRSIVTLDLTCAPFGYCTPWSNGDSTTPAK